LNSDYFNEEKGIFSKLEMDSLIPEKWRLWQESYDRERVPDAFPVFAKPEWGQNSMGIVRLENAREFQEFASRAERSAVPYIVQQAADGRQEFELYYLRSPEHADDCDAFFVTETVNRSGAVHPINSVNNPDTSYRDITATFTARQRRALWGLVRAIGRFRMARLCLKADSRHDLLKGRFQVVEINLFLPMPLVLLADNVGAGTQLRLVRQLTDTMAKLVAGLPKGRKKAIFFRKVLAHYRIGA
jgi:D-alanine-D-alanine ligase-like ATP-grasp enzyme